MAVVNGGEFSARRGLSTVSIAKKQPATAALKPEERKMQRLNNQHLEIHKINPYSETNQNQKGNTSLM